MVQKHQRDVQSGTAAALAQQRSAWAELLRCAREQSTPADRGFSAAAWRATMEGMMHRRHYAAVAALAALGLAGCGGSPQTSTENRSHNGCRDCLP